MAKPPIVEGQTATNPQSGEKIVYRGGKWYPAGQGAAFNAAALTPQERGQMDEARAAARMADEAARTAEQFQELNRKRGTGAAYSIPGVAAIRGGFDPEVSQMNALTARMAPQQRVPGSGTTSDRDLSLYLQAVPSMTKPGPANGAIARQARADAKRRAEYASFLDEYASMRGTLIGAERAWETKLRQTPPPAAKPQAPVAKPVAPQGKRLSPAEAAKLPPGTKFIGADGQERVRS